MSTVWQDVRLAGRSLARNRGWTAAGVTTLAIGIAGSTLVLSLLDQALLRPLRFSDGRQLVTLYVTSGPEYSPMPYPDYTEFRTALEDTLDLAAFCRVFMTVGGGAFPEHHEGEMVSGTFFSVLGIRPELGRLIGQGDNVVPGGHPVVVLSDFLWRTQFASDREIVGTQVHLNRVVYDVIGVAPPGFRGAVWPSFESAFWIPAMMADDYFSGRDVLNGRFFAVFQTVGRVAPGARFEAVQPRIEPLDVILSRDRESLYYTDTGAPWRVRAFPGSYLRLWPEFRDEVAAFLTILGLMAGTALAVACANMATLMLVRSIEWQHELAIRQALGAARLDVLRRLGTEVLLLVVAGSLGAAALVLWLSSLVPLLPLTVAYQLDLIPDSRVWGIGLAVALLTGCVCATPPVWRALREPLSLAGVSRTQRGGRWAAMDALVVAQVALSLMLVVGCGLLLRSAWNTRQIDPGFHALRGATTQIDFPAEWENDPNTVNTFTERLLDGLRSERLVTTASASTRRPLSFADRVEVRLTNSTAVGPETSVETDLNPVTADYFETFGIPVRAGRVFARSEARGGARVAVVNHALATRHFAGRSPVGQNLHLTDEEEPRRIVGVVGDILGRNIRIAPEPKVYVPFRQRRTRWAHVSIGVRGDGVDALTLLRRHVGRVDPTMALTEPSTFADLRRAQTRESRVQAGLAATTAGIALSLALVGLYGLMGYVVRRREREMGIRTAIGATPAAIIRLVLGHGCRLTLFGIALGSASSLATNRLLTRLLYNVESSDVATLIAVSVLFTSAAVVACWGPALRAARVNPTDALRAE